MLFLSGSVLFSQVQGPKISTFLGPDLPVLDPSNLLGNISNDPNNNMENNSFLPATMGDQAMPISPSIPSSPMGNDVLTSLGPGGLGQVDAYINKMNAQVGPVPEVKGLPTSLSHLSSGQLSGMESMMEPTAEPTGEPTGDPTYEPGEPCETWSPTVEPKENKLVPEVDQELCDEWKAKSGARSCSLVTQISGVPEGCECQLDKPCPGFDESLGFSGLSPSEVVNLPAMGPIKLQLCMYWHWKLKAEEPPKPTETDDFAAAVTKTKELIKDAVDQAYKKGVEAAAEHLWGLTAPPPPPKAPAPAPAARAPAPAPAPLISIAAMSPAPASPP